MYVLSSHGFSFFSLDQSSAHMVHYVTLHTCAGGDCSGLLPNTRSVKVVRKRKTVGITVILLQEKSSFSNFSLHISTTQQKLYVTISRRCYGISN